MRVPVARACLHPYQVLRAGRRRAAFNVSCAEVSKKRCGELVPFLFGQASVLPRQLERPYLPCVSGFTGTEACSHIITMASSSHSPLPAHTPPTPSQDGTYSRMSFASEKLPRGLLLPLSGPNGGTPPMPLPMSASMSRPSAEQQVLCTPADYEVHHTPPAELRRESLNVPPSERMVRMAQGSGVSVYRMDRSPRDGRPRSPWVIKKANVSPLLVRERRRVERTLEHESCMLSAMHHPNIVGFRAAQRLSDGHLCLALEHCEISLYQLIQERVKPGGGCVSPTREARAGMVFTAVRHAPAATAIAAFFFLLLTPSHPLFPFLCAGRGAAYFARDRLRPLLPPYLPQAHARRRQVWYAAANTRPVAAALRPHTTHLTQPLPPSLPLSPHSQHLAIARPLAH